MLAPRLSIRRPEYEMVPSAISVVVLHRIGNACLQITGSYAKQRGQSRRWSFLGQVPSFANQLIGFGYLRERKRSPVEHPPWKQPQSPNPRAMTQNLVFLAGLRAH